MKTANRHLVLSAGLMVLGLAASVSTAWAQNPPATPMPASSPPATASNVTPPAPAYLQAPPTNPAPPLAAASTKTMMAAADATVPAMAGSAAPAVTLPKEASTEVADPDVKSVEASASLPGAKKDAKGSEDNGPKVPISVKGAIKNLKVKSEDLTLDDLNAAREAIAKLDALIDIEKRLVELDKVRKERENENNKTMLAALPASALTPPSGYMQSQMQQQQRPMQTAPGTLPPVTVDVERIEGSNNHYSAFVKDGESVHQVKTGDKLSDGSVVTSISPRGVEIKRDETSHLVQVKDVQAVFGDAP